MRTVYRTWMESTEGKLLNGSQEFTTYEHPKPGDVVQLREGRFRITGLTFPPEPDGKNYVTAKLEMADNQPTTLDEAPTHFVSVLQTVRSEGWNDLHPELVFVVGPPERLHSVEHHKIAFHYAGQHITSAAFVRSVIRAYEVPGDAVWGEWIEANGT